MSLITEYQDSNDRRKDLNTPKINVALPQTQGLKPADLTEVTGAPSPAPSPQPAIAVPPSPAVAPQVETPANNVVVSPESPVAPVTASPQEAPVQVLTEDQQYEQFLSESLRTDRSSTIKDMPSLDGVQYDAVAGVQRSDADVMQANVDTETMLMMQGQSVASSIEDAYNLGEFQPTLIGGGDSMPYLTDQINEGNRVRAGLTQNIVAERQQIVEQSFQPKPLPQTGTDPRKPRPDTTAAFNRQWQGFFNDKLSPKNRYDYGRGQYGEAGNGLIGGLIYHLGLPQNLAYGAGLDIENAVQRSPLAPLYDKAGQVARGGLQAGLNAIGAFGNFVNSKIGMGQVNTQLPKDFDPVRADPKFKGSYTMNALRGEQYNFSDSSSGGEMGIVLPGNNPTFMFGLGADILGDPAGAALAALRPFRQGNKVVRTAARVGELAVDPLGEAVLPALGTVTTSIWRGGQKLLPAAPTPSPSAAKPPKKGSKKKASQAGVAPSTNKKPQNVTVKQTVEPEPPKGTPLHAAWKQRQVAKKARAQAAQVKRVIIPAPPKNAVVNPDGGTRRTIVTPEPPTPLTLTMPGGRPATRRIPTPTAAQISITDQAGKVQLVPLTPGVLMKEASEEAASRAVPKMPGRKRADLEAEVVTTPALPEGQARPQLPGVSDDVVEGERLDRLVDEGEISAAADEVKRLEDISQNGTLVTPPKQPKGILPPARTTDELADIKGRSRNTNQTDEIENGILVTPPPSAAKELLDAEVISRQLVDVGDGQVVEGVEAAKVAMQTVRRNEAELVRVASREAMAETLAPATKKVNGTFDKKPTFLLVDTRAIKTVVDATPDESLVKEILDEGGLTEPLKLNQTGIEEFELADPRQATLLASAQEAYRRDPRTAEMQNSFVYKKVKEPKAKTAAVEQKVVEARQVADAIPPETKPSIIPTVNESVFKGEMTVSEVAEQIANFRPGDVIDGQTIKKAKRTTKDLTALMKLTPHPTSGKPLIAANRGAFKTYKDIENFLLKEGIEDPTYFRMFAREGAPIPPGALDGSAFKVIANKSRPFNATPATVVDNTVPRVISGQLEMPGALPGVKLDTTVKTSFDPSVIKPIAAANKGSDFRGQLNKQRNALRKQLDEVDNPEEMEKILDRIAEIDDELAVPSLKENPGHLLQLQDEVIPDTQHGLTQEVMNLTNQKIQLEREVADISGETRRLELELADQEELLEKAATKVIENTADIGRRELDDDYIPTIPENGVTDQFFESPDLVAKKAYQNNTIYFSKEDAEFVEQSSSILMRAFDQVNIPGGVDVVVISKGVVNSMQGEALIDLAEYIADAGIPAFMDWKTGKFFVKKALLDGENVSVGEAVRIITHELAHKLHGRKVAINADLKSMNEGLKPLRDKFTPAIKADKTEVSKYAASIPPGVEKIDEDFAESVSYYLRNPWNFVEASPARARVVAEELAEATAEAANERTFYHGTRTPNWEQTADPLTTQPRNVWGQGDYLYSDVARAADDAQAELPVNTPGLAAKEVDLAGTVYEVKPNFEKVLRANDKVTPATQRLFADAIEDVLGRKTPEARKALKAFVRATSPRVVDDKMRYPIDTVKSMYGLMEKYVHKYLGTEGITLPEETLSDLYRAVNLKVREAGYDAVMDNELVVVLKPGKVTAINREVLSETDALDVLVSRFNVDSQLAKQNPTSPSAQVNMMESGVRLQKEMVEQTRVKYEQAKTEQLQKLQQFQEVNDKLTDAAKREQDAKRLSNIREGQAAEKALNERLSKPNTDPCNF